MQLLTQQLPSGYPYSITSINVNPLRFAEILEYLDQVPESPVEKFYFDYCIVKQDDPNVDNLLLCDLDFLIFFKKGLTISDNLNFNTTARCPYCGATIPVHYSLSDVTFEKLDPNLFNGLQVSIGGTTQEVRMPTVSEFMRIFSNYRRFKRITDMKIIKLVALFRDSMSYQQSIEKIVTSATYDDITTLATLDQLFYSSVKPLKVTCTNCTDENGNKRGMEIALDRLISDFFRTIIENNRLAPSKIIFRKASPGE